MGGVQGPALVPLAGVQGAEPPEALRFSTEKIHVPPFFSEINFTFPPFS